MESKSTNQSFFFYQSSMSIASATGGAATGGQLLLRWLVVVGVSEDQTLSGGGGRWLSPSNYRLLQQRDEVQTDTGTVSQWSSNRKSVYYLLYNANININ